MLLGWHRTSIGHSLLVAVAVEAPAVIAGNPGIGVGGGAEVGGGVGLCRRFGRQGILRAGIEGAHGIGVECCRGECGLGLVVVAAVVEWERSWVVSLRLSERCRGARSGLGVGERMIRAGRETVVCRED